MIIGINFLSEWKLEKKYIGGPRLKPILTGLNKESSMIKMIKDDQYQVDQGWSRSSMIKIKHDQVLSS